jgi:hypothetical protein
MVYISHIDSYTPEKDCLVMTAAGEITWDSFVTDKTLSNEGRAADAAAVGEALKNKVNKTDIA